MRGKVLLGTLYRLPVRITPAHAGKSASRCSFGIDSRDHPRTCGEKMLPEGDPGWCFGSPPHMRGKATVRDCDMILVRITPAHAGKSHFATSFHLNRRDHPRTCGEKLYRFWTFSETKGSPPHMRGKGNGRKSFAGKQGITPAHAGKSR